LNEFENSNESTQGMQIDFFTVHVAHRSLVLLYSVVNCYAFVNQALNDHFYPSTCINY